MPDADLPHSKIDGIEAIKSKVVQRTLPRYSRIVLDGLPASFQIAKRIVFNLGGSMSLEGMWDEHDRLMKKLRAIRFMVDAGKLELGELEIPRFSLLDLKIMLAQEMLKSCNLCERRCGIDRITTHRGNEVATFSEYGDKPPMGRKIGVTPRGMCGVGGDGMCHISSDAVELCGEKHMSPSHSIYLMGCNFRCRFCQKHETSQWGEAGVLADPKAMADGIGRTWRQGVRNVDWVGGEPTPQLLSVLRTLKEVGHDVNSPQVWNSNFYMSEDTLRLLDGIVDVYMPDFKYGNDVCAKHLSGVDNYFEVVARNHRLASKQAEMTVRHLVLPNHVECCTKPVLKWLAENLKKNALVSLVGRYSPDYRAHEHMDLKRMPEEQEISDALNYAKRLKLNYIS